MTSRDPDQHLAQPSAAASLDLAGDRPYIAWFNDPAGNVLSVLQER